MISTKLINFLIFLIMFALLQACSSVNSFPSLARAGSSVSLLIGGSEKARKDTIEVALIDANGVYWDLKAMGLVRSVFNIQMDAKSVGNNYSSYIDLFTSWAYGHELLQTVLVADLPVNLPVGVAEIIINTNVDDNTALLSAGIISVKIEIIEGAGAPDDFAYKSSLGDSLNADFSRLEPAPYAKIDFGHYDDFAVLIGAVSLEIDFDETVVNPDDININVPKSSVRGDMLGAGKFTDKQRMVNWRHDGQKIFLDIIAPQGINPGYLQAFIIYPPGLALNPDIMITKADVYTVDGTSMGLTPSINYFP
ncbi:MAG: hypothetical protein OQK46_09550 [Gammaproteobacteria bacterium]|nr:hypothetical protein [Gammaproteobacteria bacterium]